DAQAVKEGESVTPEEKPEEGKEDAEAKEKAVTEGESAAPKKITANERIRQLAEEKAYWKGLAEGRQKVEESPKAEIKAPEGKPTPDKFTSYDEYTEALTDWKVDQKLKTVEVEKSRASERQVFEGRINKAIEKYPDFKDVALNPSVAINPAMYEVIKDSDLGADIAYYLGSNPDEAARIAKLNPIAAIKEIAQIEARMRAPKTEVKRITQAPKPVKTVTGGGETVDKDPSTMSMEEYIAFRKKKTG
ncbi:MAG: hypothetical protein KGJ01_03360, partial [Patescibacteria group bacterium]|nr:hypothetical protein [Patescibacteria group bacterium]